MPPNPPTKTQRGEMWMRPALLFFFRRLWWRCPALGFAATPPVAGLGASRQNADSEGHFLSRFNDPCDFSARKRFLRGSSTCLPRPSSPPGPGRSGRGRGGGPLPPFYTIATAPDDRRPEQRLKWAINVQGTPPPLGYHHCPPWGADEGVE